VRDGAVIESTFENWDQETVDYPQEQTVSNFSGSAETAATYSNEYGTGVVAETTASESEIYATDRVMSEKKHGSEVMNDDEFQTQGGEVKAKIANGDGSTTDIKTALTEPDTLDKTGNQNMAKTLEQTYMEGDADTGSVDEQAASGLENWYKQNGSESLEGYDQEERKKFKNMLQDMGCNL